MPFRVRELLIRQRTMLVNGHLEQFGIVTCQGVAGRRNADRDG